jgi:hypothetical protein
MMGEISFANSDMTTITLLVSGLLHDNTLNSDTRRKTQRQMPKPTTTDTTSTRLDFVLTYERRRRTPDEKTKSDHHVS